MRWALRGYSRAKLELWRSQWVKRIGILGATIFPGVGSWLIYSMKRGARDEQVLTNSQEGVSAAAAERMKVRRSCHYC